MSGGRPQRASNQDASKQRVRANHSTVWLKLAEYVLCFNRIVVASCSRQKQSAPPLGPVHLGPDETTSSEGSESRRLIHISQNEPDEPGKDSRVRSNGAKQTMCESTTKQERTMRSRSRSETQYSQLCFQPLPQSPPRGTAMFPGPPHATATGGQGAVICNLTTRGH